MRRTRTHALVLTVLLLHLVTTGSVEAKKKREPKPPPKRTERRVTAEYRSPGTLDVGGVNIMRNCALGVSTCVVLETEPKERFASFTVFDASLRSVPVHVFLGDLRDSDGSESADEYYGFCGKGVLPLDLQGAEAITIYVGADLPGCTSGVGTTGFIETVFSNVP